MVRRAATETLCNMAGEASLLTVSGVCVLAS